MYRINTVTATVQKVNTLSTMTEKVEEKTNTNAQTKTTRINIIISLPLFILHCDLVRNSHHVRTVVFSRMLFCFNQHKTYNQQIKLRSEEPVL